MPEEQNAFEEFFAAAQVLHLSQDIAARAIGLRQQRKLSLGDSIIAATALQHRLTLVTRNTEDFDWIDGLTLWNPLL